MKPSKCRECNVIWETETELHKFGECDKCRHRVVYAK